MANEYPIVLIEKIVEKLEAERLTGGTLTDVKKVDFGGSVIPATTIELPLIFVTISSANFPEMFAASGAEESYTENYKILIVIYCYEIKNGHKQAFIDATNLAKKVIKLCHANKTWDGLVYTSEVAEEESADFGSVPWGEQANNLVFGVSVPLWCRRKSQS